MEVDLQLVKLEQQIKDSICQIFENDKNFVTCSVKNKGDICHVDLVHEKPGHVIGRNARHIKSLSTIIRTISKKNPRISVLDSLYQKRKRMLARQQEILAECSMEGML